MRAAFEARHSGREKSQSNVLETSTRQLGLGSNRLKLFAFCSVEIFGDLLFRDANAWAAVVGELAGFDEVVDRRDRAVEALGDFVDFQERHVSGPFQCG